MSGGHGHTWQRRNGTVHSVHWVQSRSVPRPEVKWIYDLPPPCSALLPRSPFIPPIRPAGEFSTLTLLQVASTPRSPGLHGLAAASAGETRLLHPIDCSAPIRGCSGSYGIFAARIPCGVGVCLMAGVVGIVIISVGNLFRVVIVEICSEGCGGFLR